MKDRGMSHRGHGMSWAGSDVSGPCARGAHTGSGDPWKHTDNQQEDIPQHPTDSAGTHHTSPSGSLSLFTLEDTILTMGYFFMCGMRFEL